MFLSKHSSGVYYLFFHDELGNRRKVSTRCRHKVEATQFLQRFKVNEYEKKIKLERKSLGEFQDDFLRYSSTVHAPKTQKCFKVAFREFKRIIGDIPLHKVGVREIERFLATKKAEASAWTARKYYISLASALETAKRWNCITDNPFRLVEKPKVNELQPAYFTKPDFLKLLGTIEDKDFRELCICAVSTGLRLGELTALEWDSIDFVRKVVLVRNTQTFTTKSGKNRVVPMNEQLWKLLALRKERATSELVFHTEGRKLEEGFVSKNFKKHVRLAMLNDRLHFHSLRHTFASWLVQDGVSLYEVQKLLGHSSSETTEIYSHLQPEQLHRTVNRISIEMN
jgi:integrase